jgi:hypothetical protein
MADKKEIEIGIKASGGKEAAAEVQAVGDSFDRLKVAAQEALDSDATITEKREALLALSEALDEAAASAEEFGTADEAASAQISKMREEIEAAHAALDKQVEAEAKGIPITGNSTKEADKKAAAMRKLEGAVNSLIPGFGAVREKVTNLTAAWKASGTAGAGLGSRLLALAGGPIGILTAAVGAAAIVVGKFKDSIAAAEQAIADANAVEIDWKADRTEAAATAATNLATALGETNTKAEKANELWEIGADRLAKLREAKDKYERAQIAAKVARGEITSEEGQARNRELDIKNVKEETAAEMEAAQKTKADAADEVERTRTALTQAQRDLDAAEVRNQKREAEAKKAATEIKQKADNAEKLVELSKYNGGVIEGDDQAKFAELAGGEDELRAKLQDQTGFFAGASQLSMAAGAAPSASLNVLTAPKVAEQIAQEAKESEEALQVTTAAEAKAASEALKKREELVATLEKQLADARETERAATLRIEDVKATQAINEQYVIPTAQTDAAGLRDKARIEAEAARKKAEEAAAKKSQKEAEDAARAQVTEQVNTEAVGLSDDLGRVVKNGTRSGVDEELLKVLTAARAKLADGTTEGEANRIVADIGLAFDEIIPSQRRVVEAALKPVVARIAQLAEQLKKNRPGQ